jgi:MoxR-like ATPase
MLDQSAIANLRPKLDPFYRAVEGVLIGQRRLVDGLLIGLLTDGHVLLEGVPGLAKTLAVSTVARALNLKFRRIQFTPDLLPADVIGTQIYNPRTGEFTVKQGPVFANIVLADEINRAPAKVQSALLEAMAERQVTIGESSLRLPRPFFVLATQNPIEQEGTYPLPEAQQDRFMFKVYVKYPSFNEEFEIARRTTGVAADEITPVLGGEQIQEIQTLVRKVPVTDHVIHYCLALVRQTRVGEPGTPKFVRDWLSWGAGPRAVQNLVLGGKARALLYGRAHVTTEDIKALAFPVLRHRILTNFTAASEGVNTDTVVKKLVEETPEKEGQLLGDPRFQKIFAS